MTEEEYKKEKAKFYNLITVKNKKIIALRSWIEALEKAKQELDNIANNVGTTVKYYTAAEKHAELLKKCLTDILGKSCGITANMLLTQVITNSKLQKCISISKKLLSKLEAFDPYWIKVITYANTLLFAHKTLEDIKKTSRNKTCKNTQQIIDDMREGQKAMTEFVKGIKKLSSFSNNSVPGKIIRFYLDFFIAADCFFDKIYAYSKRIAQEIKTLEKNLGTILNGKITRERLLNSDLVNCKEKIIK